jgi:hypothetical protein
MRTVPEARIPPPPTPTIPGSIQIAEAVRVPPPFLTLNLAYFRGCLTDRKNSLTIKKNNGIWARYYQLQTWKKINFNKMFNSPSFPKRLQSLARMSPIAAPAAVHARVALFNVLRARLVTKGLNTRLFASCWSCPAAQGLPASRS